MRKLPSPDKLVEFYIRNITLYFIYVPFVFLVRAFFVLRLFRSIIM